MTDNRVCLVLISDFGERLRHIDLAIPVWVIQSQENDPVVADLWRSKAGNITSFQSQGFGQLVDTVDQHHPGWRELEVRGITFEEAETSLADYGSGQFTSTMDGFVFRRANA